MIWARDAKQNPKFHRFEAKLLVLVRRLSGNKVMTRANQAAALASCRNALLLAQGSARFH